jgi:hypothetical protein
VAESRVAEVVDAGLYADYHPRFEGAREYARA